MSYIALATESFNAVVSFYGETLGFPVVAQWDRAGGRGRRFDLGGGLRLEILDNTRERHPLRLCEPGERTHVVVEVANIEAAHSRLPISAPSPQSVSWGAKVFQLHDPDGVPVTFLEWNEAREEAA